jgi:2-iminobutanoate/2-iminopropanoate deaminase
MPKITISAHDAPAAFGPYSHAVKVGSLILASGQLGLDPVTGLMVEGDIVAQTKQAMINLRAVLKAGGSSLDNVVKTTVFITDMDRFGDVNAVYETYMGQNKPARSCVEVARLPRGGLVEVEAIALVE